MRTLVEELVSAAFYEAEAFYDEYNVGMSGDDEIEYNPFAEAFKNAKWDEE